MITYFNKLKLRIEISEYTYRVTTQVVQNLPLTLVTVPFYHKDLMLKRNFHIDH